mgnify:CR=1 FL=1|tara:strand:+ start:2027 stop:2626 length:600 start_codon:yes stop_codon:yes gene_type:complete
MIHETITDRNITGKVQVSYVKGDIWTPISGWLDNIVLYEWSNIVSSLVYPASDSKDYTIKGMYLEYESNNSGSTINPTPTFDRTGGVQTAPSYWENLGTNRDYLRLKVDSYKKVVGTNEVTVTFRAQSTGAVGTKTTSPVTFSDAVNSRVYGCALAAYPGGTADKSQDLVFSRFYFSGSSQVDKLAGSNIGIAWSINFS